MLEIGEHPVVPRSLAGLDIDLDSPETPVAPNNRRFFFAANGG
jgi:hypothetical protein